MNKYTITVTPEMIDQMRKALKEFKAEMMKPSISRYIEYLFLQLSEDTFVKLKFDRFYKYDDKGQLKPEYEKSQKNKDS